jgi:hypothetical protein
MLVVMSDGLKFGEFWLRCPDVVIMKLCVHIVVLHAVGRMFWTTCSGEACVDGCRMIDALFAMQLMLHSMATTEVEGPK